MNYYNMIFTFVGAPLMFAFLIWSIFLKERFRARKLRALAPQLGFSMLNGPGKLAKTEFRFGTPLFLRGERGSNRMWSAMEGVSAGLRTLLFDLSYEVTVNTGDDSGTQVTRRTVAAFSAPDVDLPTFSIARRGFFSRFESNEVKIDAHPDFDARFFVSGKDAAAIRALLNPALAQFLLLAKLPDRLVIEGAGSWLVLYRKSKRLPPQQWKQFLNESAATASSFLAHCRYIQTAKAG